jgi:hypothetical protein
MVEDYSQWLRKKTDVGHSRLVFDVLNETEPNVDPGAFWSNGNRYAYLRYRANTVPQCSFPEGGTRVITSYAGNPVMTLTRDIILNATTRKVTLMRVIQTTNNSPTMPPNFPGV